MFYKSLHTKVYNVLFSFYHENVFNIQQSRIWVLCDCYHVNQHHFFLELFFLFLYKYHLEVMLLLKSLIYYKNGGLVIFLILGKLQKILFTFSLLFCGGHSLILYSKSEMNKTLLNRPSYIFVSELLSACSSMAFLF